MDAERRALYIKEDNAIDVKNNVKMAEWTKDVFFELNQKLDNHFQTDKNQSDENFESRKGSASPYRI